MRMDQVSRFSVEKFTPSNLNNSQVNELRLSMQEAWSAESSLGELAQCESCSLIYSKESLFVGIPGINTRLEAITDILDKLGMKESYCFCRNQNCGGKLSFPYGIEYNGHLSDCFGSRNNGILVLIRDLDRHGKIVGFECGYSGTIDEVFYEFKDHYGNFDKNIFRDAIANVLGNIPPQFFVCASIGIDQFYRRKIRTSMNILILLLKAFCESIPNNIIAITETDRRNVLHRLMTQNGARSLELDISDYGKNCLQGKKQPAYETDILVHNTPIICYQAVIRDIIDATHIKIATVVTS